MRFSRWAPAGLATVLLVVAACSSATNDTGQKEDAATSTGKEDAPEPDGRFVDTCDPKAACTPIPAGYDDGAGLAPAERCAFALEESTGLGSGSPLVAALEKITKKVAFADVVVDGNRVATKTSDVPGAPLGVAYAFRWQDDDDASESWIPQGITGTADADPSGKVEAKSAVLVSFYDKALEGGPNRGARIAIVDTTSPTAPRYRFALLAEPKGTEAAPQIAPVVFHAGGLAWYGDYLYVVDTSKGLRVFDMRHILEVATGSETMGCTATKCEAFNYKYVIPQVGSYKSVSTCKPIFSWVSLDRSTDPPSLATGEYCSSDACSGPLAGRIYHWPLDPKTGLLRSKTTYPLDVSFMSHKQIQGGASYKGTYFFSSSAPAFGGGELHRVAGSRSATSNWSDSPEDLMVDSANGWLWSLSEHAKERAVYAAKLSSYPKP